MVIDWISIVFWVIIGFRILMGFWKGGLKTLFMLAVFALGIGLAFALCRPVGGWIGDLGARAWVNDGIFGRLKDIEVFSFGGTSMTLGTEIDRAQLETAHAAWIAAGNTGTLEDMLREALHSGYSSCFVPSSAYGTLDGIILQNIPDIGTFSLAGIVASSVAQVVCVIIGFAAVLVATFLIGFIVLIIVSAVRKAAGKRPGMVSRLLGIVFGCVSAFVTCWTITIVLKSIGSCFTPMNDFFVTSMRLDDPSYWNIGKFFFNINFGYGDLFNWIMGFLFPKQA